MMEERSTIAKPELLSRLSCSKSSEASPPHRHQKRLSQNFIFSHQSAMPEFGFFDSSGKCAKNRNHCILYQVKGKGKGDHSC